ncbi:hypothetical protein A5gp_00058 [Alteromonas phage vB_AemP_PT15-A5]|nr:hypothetical protein A5gp_00058 [Alteromonas phage vB_AemP_PT15-A5]
MSVKSHLHEQFREALVKRKIQLTAAEYSATTVFFGVNSANDLISQDSITLYKSGEAVVNKVLGKTKDDE